MLADYTCGEQGAPAEFRHDLQGDGSVWGAGSGGQWTGESEHRSLGQIASGCSENPWKKLDVFAGIQAHSGPLCAYQQSDVCGTLSSATTRVRWISSPVDSAAHNHLARLQRDVPC